MSTTHPQSRATDKEAPAPLNPPKSQCSFRCLLNSRHCSKWTRPEKSYLKRTITIDGTVRPDRPRAPVSDWLSGNSPHKRRLQNSGFYLVSENCGEKLLQRATATIPVLPRICFLHRWPSQIRSGSAIRSCAASDSGREMGVVGNLTAAVPVGRHFSAKPHIGSYRNKHDNSGCYERIANCQPMPLSAARVLRDRGIRCRSINECAFDEFRRVSRERTRRAIVYVLGSVQQTLIALLN